MTPQEWIKCAPDFEAAGNCTPETMVHEASFVTEGAQHLAAALEEIAQLREKVAAAEEFAENMRKNRDEVLRTSTKQANDSARLRIVVQNVYAMIANEVRR